MLGESSMKIGLCIVIFIQSLLGLAEALSLSSHKIKTRDTNNHNHNTYAKLQMQVSNSNPINNKIFVYNKIIYPPRHIITIMALLIIISHHPTNPKNNHHSKSGEWTWQDIDVSKGKLALQIATYKTANYHTLLYIFSLHSL